MQYHDQQNADGHSGRNGREDREKALSKPSIVCVLVDSVTLHQPFSSYFFYFCVCVFVKGEENPRTIYKYLPKSENIETGHYWCHFRRAVETGQNQRLDCPGLERTGLGPYRQRTNRWMDIIAATK